MSSCIAHGIGQVRSDNSTGNHLGAGFTMDCNSSYFIWVRTSSQPLMKQGRSPMKHFVQLQAIAHLFPPPQYT